MTLSVIYACHPGYAYIYIYALDLVIMVWQSGHTAWQCPMAMPMAMDMGHHDSCQSQFVSWFLSITIGWYITLASEHTGYLLPGRVEWFMAMTRRYLYCTANGRVVNWHVGSSRCYVRCRLTRLYHAVIVCHQHFPCKFTHIINLSPGRSPFKWQ